MKPCSNIEAVEARPRGRPLELHIGSETIDVWFDEAGIHFNQPGGRCGGSVLPWTEAIALSLIPPHQPRHGSAIAV